MIIDYYFKVNKSVWQFYQNHSLILIIAFETTPMVILYGIALSLL